MLQDNSRYSSNMGSTFHSNMNHQEDKMVGYTFTSSRAGGEAAAASIAHEGVNHKWFQLDRISPAGNTLSFSLLERFGVHLRSNGERISHECNCDAHHPEGACSHVYWALDQVIRASTNGTHIGCHVELEGRSLFATVNNNYISPILVAQGVGKRSLEQETEKHTYAEVRFRVVTDRVRKGAEQTFLWQSEQTFVQLASIVHAFEPIISVGGGKAYTVEKALHELEEYAYSLLEAFQALVWLLQQEENPEGRYQSAINKAANVYLFMMRGILVRVGDNNLRYVAAKASYEEQDRNFWAIVHDFFTPILGYQHRLDGNLNHDHANKLAALRDFINETYVDQRDGSVMQKIDEWLGH